MNLNGMHPADVLALFMERIYRGRMTTTSGGNLSILDENGDMWITPGGTDKGNLKRGDIVCVKRDGTRIGRYAPSSEYPFHLKIYRTCPQMRAVLHAHSPAVTAFSAVHRLPDTMLFPAAYEHCGKVSMAKYALTGSEELGDVIAAEFRKGCDIAVLENHGLVSAGRTMEEAFFRFEALEFTAWIEMNADRLGGARRMDEAAYRAGRRRLQGEESALRAGGAASEAGTSALRAGGAVPEVGTSALRAGGAVPDAGTSALRVGGAVSDAGTSFRYPAEEWRARQELCRFIRRAYRQKLICGAWGSFSVRLGSDEFVMTPKASDRCHIRADELVHIAGGRVEEGKKADGYLALHRELYKQHPGIGAVIAAQPVSAMAFALTGRELDTRLIPESYMVLREISRYRFEKYYGKPELAAADKKDAEALLLLENDAIVAVGKTLLEAFDRLEVADYSAQALLNAQGIGRIVPIPAEQIKELGEKVR